jgi:protein TonB
MAEARPPLSSTVPIDALAIAVLPDENMLDDAVAIVSTVPTRSDPPEADPGDVVAEGHKPANDAVPEPPEPAPVVPPASLPGNEPVQVADADLPRPAVKAGKNVWLQQVRKKSPVGMSALDVQHYRAPAYPFRALEDGIAGMVDLSFAVAPNGQPVGIDILHAEPFGTFDDAALDAVREWRFHSVDGGKHVKVRLRFIPEAG